MTVTPIRTRVRSNRTRPAQAIPRPGTAEFLEAQAVKWPEHAADLLAEADRLRNQQAA